MILYISSLEDPAYSYHKMVIYIGSLEDHTYSYHKMVLYICLQEDSTYSYHNNYGPLHLAYSLEDPTHSKAYNNMVLSIG